jgi:hypothetical protein
MLGACIGQVQFGTLNVGSLYRAGSITAAARDLARCKLDLVDVREIRWDKGFPVRARSGHGQSTVRVRSGHGQSTCIVDWSLYSGMIGTNLFYQFCAFYGLLNFHFKHNKNLFFDSCFCK